MSAPPTVHPLAPRFAQGITAALCIEALAFHTPGAVVAAFVLVAVALFAPRFSPVGWVFRRVAPPPRELEPAAPTRFSQLLAVVFLGLASVALFTGLTLVGWILTGMVACLALLSATTGLCVGCEIYRLALARRTDHGEDPASTSMGLDGEGPWLVMLTAPGCARCEPAARELEAVAGRPVRRVDLSRTLSAAKLPVRSVPRRPGGADGRLHAVRAGRLDYRAVLAEVAAAV
ncbi:MAG: DUF4395 domain-containing protein [Thermoleophilia bacterium]